MASAERPSEEAVLGTSGAAVTSRLPRRLSTASDQADHLSDEVVDAAKRGERAAWEAAYLAYGKGLMGFLVLRLGDRDDAAEALSETFLRALEKIRTLRGGADAFRAWLFRIARNVATDRLRARSRVLLERDSLDAADLLRGGPAETVIAAEEADEVRSALLALSPDDQEVVWLRVCSGLTSEEVGSIVGKRPGAVRMQQLRALDAMAKRLVP